MCELGRILSTSSSLPCFSSSVCSDQTRPSDVLWGCVSRFSGGSDPNPPPPRPFFPVMRSRITESQAWLQTPPLRNDVQSPLEVQRPSPSGELHTPTVLILTPAASCTDKANGQGYVVNWISSFPRHQQQVFNAHWLLTLNFHTVNSLVKKKI